MSLRDLRYDLSIWASSSNFSNRMFFSWENLNSRCSFFNCRFSSCISRRSIMLVLRSLLSSLLSDIKALLLLLPLLLALLSPTRSCCLLANSFHRTRLLKSATLLLVPAPPIIVLVFLLPRICLISLVCLSLSRALVDGSAKKNDFTILNTLRSALEPLLAEAVLSP